MLNLHLLRKPGVEEQAVLSCGGFAFEICENFLKWPDGEENRKVASVFCDTDDNIYLLTRGSKNALMVFDADGGFLYRGEDDFFASAHGLFITGDGTLLTTDSSRHVCLFLDRRGRLLRRMGEFDVPSDSGYDPQAYEKLRQSKMISDAQPYDRYAEFLARLDTVARRAGPFNRPTRLIEAADKTLFCSDGYGNAAVHHFDASGALIGSWGAPGRNPGEFRTVHGIWEDRLNRIWVADRENSRVQAFSHDGKLLAVVDGLLRATDFWEFENHLYIAEADGGITILNTGTLQVAAVLGGYHSRLRCHSIGGNSLGDLFIANLGLSKRDKFIKLKRIR